LALRADCFDRHVGKSPAAPNALSAVKNVSATED
jgi:hypothetical protein